MEKLLIVAGPTATGKTGLAISLAQRFNGELINADSRQMYQGFDIISGKDIPRGSKSEYKQLANIRGLEIPLVTYRIGDIPIWLYDVVPPEDEVSIALFRDLARTCMLEISGRGKLPIIVGGTGYYLSSIQHPIDSIDIPRDQHLRNSLVDVPLEYLQKKLGYLDEMRWNGMNQSDRANPRRLMRAIEIAEWKKTHRVTVGDSTDLDILMLGLMTDDPGYEERIHERVLDRMKQGALEEARNMNKLKLSPNIQTIIGYPVLKKYLDGSISYDEAIREWTKKEVQYAKRQVTWFRKQRNILWYPAHDSASLPDIEKAVSAWYTT